MREDRGMEHVGVRDDEAPAAPDPSSNVGWRVAIVHLRFPGRVRVGEQLEQVVEFGGLILAQRLRRKQIERRPVSIERVEDRQVVAERFSACRRRDHDGVATRKRMVERFGLMAVDALETLPFEHPRDARVECVRHVAIDRFTGGNVMDCGEMLPETVALFPVLDELFQG